MRPLNAALLLLAAGLRFPLPFALRRALFTRRTRALLGAALVLSANHALGHHGWSWAETVLDTVATWPGAVWLQGSGTA